MTATFTWNTLLGLFSSILLHIIDTIVNLMSTNDFHELCVQPILTDFNYPVSDFGVLFCMK